MFNYDFVISQIPLMIRLCNQVMQRHESNSVERGTTEGKTHRIDLMEVAVEIFSTVVLSSFLGMEASQDTIEGQTIQEAVLDMFKMSQRFARESKSVLLFGKKFIQMGLTKRHRKFNQKEQKIREFIRRKIRKLSSESNE